MCCGVSESQTESTHRNFGMPDVTEDEQQQLFHVVLKAVVVPGDWIR